MSAQTATILVTDLVGSTELRVQLGEEQADVLRRAHDDLLNTAIAAHGGTVVKGLGDGVLAMFASSADAVSAAVEAQQAVHRQGRSQPDIDLSIRVGISVGDVTLEDGDCFGTPVIEAARLCAAAHGGQVLAADLVEALARGRGGHVYEPVGDLELKGLPAPVRTVAVQWAPTESGPLEQPPFPPLLRDERNFSFVGRSEPLDLLVGLWKRSATGERRCALLAGEPGVGKTRLAAEVALRAHEQGAVVLLGRCEEELGLPFQPFVEALAHYVAVAGPSADDLGRHPADLARLYPELAELVPGLGEPLRGEAEVERHRLFEATASWLTSAAEANGLVLVLDDLHWAGKPTLLLLRHVLRTVNDARLLVIGTYRDTDLDRTHPLGELLADLRREPGVERVPLSGFTAEEVEAFVAAAAGEELDDEKRALAAAVHAETEGNAFFVGEVLRHLAESGAIVQVDGSWQAAVALDAMAIPEGVREVVGRRVSRLSAQANDVLRWASVIGRDVDFAVLAAVVDGPEDELLSALDDAIDARLVEETGRGSYRFTHALVRSTLLDEVRTTRRVRMHLRIAEAIEQVRPDDVAALARHFYEAASAGGEAKAVTYLERAARMATDRSAFDEAITCYAQALELLDDSPSPSPARRLDLLLGLGTAAFALGGGSHEGPLAEALTLARSLNDAERMAEALLVSHRGWGSIAFAVNEPLVADLQETLARLPNADSVSRARLMVTLALELAGDRTEVARVQALQQDATAMARRLGDDRALLDAAFGAWNCRLAPLSPEAATAMLVEMEALADRLGDVTLQAICVTGGMHVALERADLVEAKSLLRAYRQRTELFGTALMRWWSTFAGAGVHLYQGDHEAAEPLIEEALLLGQEAGQPDVFQYYGNQLGFLRRQQGRSDEVVDMFADWIAPHPPGHEYWQGFLALLLTECGRLDDARQLFDVGYGIYPGHRFDQNFVVHGATLAHAAVDLGDRDAAAQLLEALSPFRGQLAHWGPLSTVGPVDLATARLLLLLDRPGEAAEHLTTSVEMCERGGLRPFLAQSQLVQGEAAMALGDRDGARALLTDALEQSMAGGFGSTERRAAARLVDLV